MATYICFNGKSWNLNHLNDSRAATNFRNGRTETCTPPKRQQTMKLITSVSVTEHSPPDMIKSLSSINTYHWTAGLTSLIHYLPVIRFPWLVGHKNVASHPGIHPFPTFESIQPHSGTRPGPVPRANCSCVPRCPWEAQYLPVWDLEIHKTTSSESADSGGILISIFTRKYPPESGRISIVIGRDPSCPGWAAVQDCCQPSEWSGLLARAQMGTLLQMWLGREDVSLLLHRLLP